MPLRSGKTRNETITIKKRPYKRKQPSEQTQQSGDDFQQELVLEDSLEESIEKLNELELTHDEYGREVPKNNIYLYAALDEENDLKGCLTEEEEQQQLNEQQNKRGKKNVFKPIDDRSHRFLSEEEIDMYIRLREQFNLKITNNNLVKCSYSDCVKVERHDMVCKYLKCECKQVNCTLKYQYRHCDSQDEWQLFREGNLSSTYIFLINFN